MLLIVPAIWRQIILIQAQLKIKLELNLIPGIVGYEILRGSREGNKSIFAKGLINNMRLFNANGGLGQFEAALYPNYPYNDLSPDRYLSGTDTRHSSFLNANAAYLTGDNPYSGVLRNKFTFHSPETNFRNPFLSPKEIHKRGSECDAK